MLFLKPWCLLISAQAVFTASVCIVNLCQLCLCTCSFLFVAVDENRLGTSSGQQGGPFSIHEMSLCAPKCLVTQVKTSVIFHLKVFHLNSYQKARKIICFHRNYHFLVWLYCSRHQELVVTKSGLFLVGFSGDLASVWHWPTTEELEGLILKIYMGLEEVGKKTTMIKPTFLWN